MKKESLFVAVLALVCACISCNKGKELVQEPAEYLLTAGTEGAGDDTKTYIANGNWGKDIKWLEDDQIAVFSEHSSIYTYKLKEGANTISGVFSTSTKPDFKSDCKYTAYYPASVVKDDNGRTFNWPSEQTRVLYYPERVALPLLAEGGIEDGAPSNATFNCLGGVLDILLKVPADGIAGYVRKVVITTDQKISGKFTLQTVTEQVRDSQGNLTSETVEKKYAVIANDGSNSITYTLEGNYGKGMYVSQGDKLQHHLILAMPVSPKDGYTNFQVDFYDQHGNRISGAKSKNPLVIERGMVTNANIPFSHKYAPGLTMNSPVGTIGTLYGVEAIVVEIKGYKRALALHNVGYTDANPAGTLFHFDQNSWDETNTGLTNGWRLPYFEEMYAMDDSFRVPQTKKSDAYLWDIYGTTVQLPLPTQGRSDHYACAHTGYVHFGTGTDSHFYMYVNSVGPSQDCYVRAIRELPFYPELDPERQLTKDDPVGSIGMIGTRQAVVMKLRGYKVAVATIDVGGSVPEEPGNRFSFNGSGNHPWNYDQLNLTDGWRLPTSQEITELSSSSGFRIIDGDVWRWPISDVATLVVPRLADYVTGETCYYYDCDNDGVGQGEILNLCARPFHSLEEISKDSPEGTVGVVDGRECVVVKGENTKILITVNNPGPCYGGFGFNEEDTPWRFDSYKHGTFRTPQQAKNDISNGFYGNGWNIPTASDLAYILDWSGYTRIWNEREKRIEINIKDSYTWYLYAGGWIDPGQVKARNTDVGYYLCTAKGQFSYLKADDKINYYEISSDYGSSCRYNLCLTHEMPN